jgi:hypothetical protein
MTTPKLMRHGFKLGPIIKLDDDVYIEWSSVSDAFTYAYNKQQIEHLIGVEIEIAEQHLAQLKDRLRRIEENGSSYIWDEDETPETPEQLVAGNRMGANERHLAYKTIVNMAKKQIDPTIDYSEEDL